VHAICDDTCQPTKWGFKIVFKFQDYNCQVSTVGELKFKESLGENHEIGLN